MKKNMGTVDKILRVIVAIALITLYFIEVISGTVGIILIALSVIFVLTSLVSFCPIYTIFGMNTCKVKD